MKNLFLTGDIKVGKTTILKHILKKVDVSIGGYITDRSYQDNTRKFTALSLYDNVSAFNIAKVDRDTFDKKIYLDTFKIHLVSLIEKSMKYRDMVVLDELGFMEDSISPFKKQIFSLLDSSTPVFGIIKKYDCDFLNSIRNRDDVIVVEITESNRDNIESYVIDILKSFNIKFKNCN